MVDRQGIWAVDPTRPRGGPSDRIQLSNQPGEPFGSKLLILRWPSEEGENRPGLLVLNAAGSETMVLQAPWVIFSASLSPMGPRSRTRAVPAFTPSGWRGKPAHGPPRPASVVLL
jgi:hypothetical protein